MSTTGLPQTGASFSLMEQNHPTEPPYCLVAIGVEPAIQGHGVGARLLGPVLERCDHERGTAYLESANKRNLEESLSQVRCRIRGERSRPQDQSATMVPDHRPRRRPRHYPGVREGLLMPHYPDRPR